MAIPPGNTIRGVASWPYRLYLSAQATSMVGTSMSTATIYWLTIHVADGKAIILSILVAAQFFPILLLGRLAGALVTRYPAVRVLTVTQSAQAIGGLSLGVPLLAGWIAVWYLWAVSFATGCAIAIDVTARPMFMLDLVGPGELRRGSSLYAAFTGLAKIAGPALAGVIIATIGESISFIADAASFLPVIVVLTVLRGNFHATKPARSAVDPKLRRITWIFTLPKQVRVAVFAAFLIGGFGYQFEITNPLMATDVFHLSPTGFGLLGTCIACGGIAGSYISSRRADPSHREFLAWAGMFGIVELLVALASAAWAYDIGMVFIGAATALFGSTTMVFIQKSTAEDKRSHAVSAYNTAYMGFVPVGAFVIAGLSAFAGTRLSLALPGILIMAYAIFSLSATRRPSRQNCSPTCTTDAAPKSSSATSTQFSSLGGI
jgi:MFS family permease